MKQRQKYSVSVPFGLAMYLTYGQAGQNSIHAVPAQSDNYFRINGIYLLFQKWQKC